jgi:hypothetical protein
MIEYVLKGTWAVEVKSGRGDRTSGLAAFRRRYPRSKVWLVGESGIPLTEFLARPPSEWFA